MQAGRADQPDPSVTGSGSAPRRSRRVIADHWRGPGSRLQQLHHSLVGGGLGQAALRAIPGTQAGKPTAVKVDAETGMNLEAKGQAVLKGATVNIN